MLYIYVRPLIEYEYKFDSLDGCLLSTINSQASIKSHYFTLQSSSPYLSSHLSNLKRSLRKL